jgi:hypothetical protein
MHLHSAMYNYTQDGCIGQTKKGDSYYKLQHNEKHDNPIHYI